MPLFFLTSPVLGDRAEVVERQRQGMEEKALQEEEERREEEREENLIEKLGVDFIRESLHLVHNNLKLAVFIADYYIACLKEDTVWFRENVSFVYSREMCEQNINHWRDQIREKYPLMRAYLIILNYRGFLSYRFSKNKFQPETDWSDLTSEHHLTDSKLEELKMIEDFEWESQQRQASLNYAQTNHMIQHGFPGLAKLPPVSVDEVIFAEQLFDKNNFAEKVLSEGRELPEDIKKDEQVVCASPSPTLIVNELSNCFDEKYKELLLGNKDEKVPGLPILGFVTSAEPGDHELASAIAKIRENSLELLNDLREEYFVSDSTGGFFLKDRDFSFNKNLEIFKYFSNRLKNDYDGYAGLIGQGHSNDQIMELVDIGRQKYKDKEENQLYIEMGLMVGWAIGCYAFFRNPLARGICELPIGLGANAWFFVIDTSRYEEALRVALYRPDDSRPPYTEISELSDLSFNRMLSMLMLPFFTGVPNILKAVK